MEHMDETQSLVILAGIIAVHRLVNVALQIHLGDKVVCTEHHTLEVSRFYLFFSLWL